MGVDTIPKESQSTLQNLKPDMIESLINSQDSLVSIPIKTRFVSLNVILIALAKLNKKFLFMGNSYSSSYPVSAEIFFFH